MADYKTPGVYIEEIPKLPPSIASVETAIPAFVGYTEKAIKKVADDLLMEPTRITSMRGSSFSRSADSARTSASRFCIGM